MDQTPASMRKHVVLLGPANAGKSTLFNALTGQERSIVSPKPGTTTDPVHAPMELIPFGPVVLVDTAGLGDNSDLGKARMEQTSKVSRRADAFIYVADAVDFDQRQYEKFRREGRPHLLTFAKCTEAPHLVLDILKAQYPQAVFLSEASGVEHLRQRLARLLQTQTVQDRPMLGDLLPANSTVVLVIPVDSEAPKGRLILPQVQLLRDCLDHGIQCMVTRDTELAQALDTLKKVDLVVTDSQVFGPVNALLPPEVPLTSFSMLLARQKGNFAQLLAGVEGIAALNEGASILMLEGCTHNHTHEDIGRVKIPALLQKKTGKRFRFDIHSGYDFPEDLAPYGLAVQCGSCMIGQGEITARLNKMERAGLPVTNYGILLAWCNGILDRCGEIFRRQAAR